ncbi:MAG: hypothetical protein KIT84_34950 [Labilithrix sp.]|nr:hypothetical protein [Labilithrix sp.]MCW5816248.1 hypothetical protein [Labilithrix sp.]
MSIRGRARPGGAHTKELLALAGRWIESWRVTARAKSAGVDFIAGLTVAAVALPLNIGLAIASGMPPSSALFAGALGGFLGGVLGSSQHMVSGPSVPLSVMLLALAHDFGVTGVAAAAVLMGIAQLVMGFTRAGRVAKYVPESVLAGFTTGVGLRLLSSQFPELLGFPEVVDWAPDHHPDTIDIVSMMHRPRWLHDVSWSAAICGIFVIFVVTATRSLRRFPAAIVSIALVTFVSVYLRWDVERVGSVGEVSSVLPQLTFPVVRDEDWLDLLIRVIPIALLGSTETLLSARAADRMADTKTPHDPNVELVGHGFSNIACGLVAGMPVTGAAARSGVNVQSGARTRLSAVFHALIMVGAVMFLSHAIGQIPLAALAGLLCIIGWRLIDVGMLLQLVRTDRLAALAFLVATAGTVTGNLLTGLALGLALHFFDQWLHRHERAAVTALEENKRKGIRAVLTKEAAEARRPAHFEHLPSEYRKWLGQIREEPLVARSAYVHPAATVIGRVVVGDRAHIAADTSVRADEGAPFHIGPNTNLQDGVVLHALKDKRVVVAGEPWAIYVGKNVSIAHDALVHGPCYIGDETFVGFKAVVHDSVVGAHCFIGIGAVVVGVEIPSHRFVPHGRIVDSADAVAALPPVSEAHAEFNEDVVEVNRGLAVAYHALDREQTQRALDDDDDRARFGPLWDFPWATDLPKERF